MVFLPGTDRSVCEMEDVMKIDTQIVDRYLSGKPLLTGEEDRIPLDQSALEMDRREVVAELKTRTQLVYKYCSLKAEQRDDKS